MLLGLAAVTLWRTRRTEGNRVWRYGRRGLFGLAGALVAAALVFPIGFAYVTTHAARAVVPENELGAPYENVSFETSDGLTMKGWYVPSKNGAAVISFPGRKGPQKPAAMLARLVLEIAVLSPECGRRARSLAGAGEVLISAETAGACATLLNDGKIRVGDPLRHFRGVLTGVPVFEGPTEPLLGTLRRQ